MKKFELELQSWIDGELDSAAAEAMASRVAADPALAALAEELRTLKVLLKDQEQAFPVDVPMPENAYWQGIEKRIEAGSGGATVDAEAEVAGSRGWLRFLIPFAVAAVALSVLDVGSWFGGRGTGRGGGSEVAEEVMTELADGKMTTFNFRSEKAGITVVWVADAE